MYYEIEIYMGKVMQIHLLMRECVAARGMVELKCCYVFKWSQDDVKL